MCSPALKVSTLALVIAATFAFSSQASAQSTIDDRANALFSAGMALTQETSSDTTTEIFQMGAVYSNAIQVASQNGDRVAAAKLAAQFSQDMKRVVSAGIADAEDNVQEIQDKLGRLLKLATVPATIARIDNYLGLLGVSFHVAKEEIFNAENVANWFPMHHSAANTAQNGF